MAEALEDTGVFFEEAPLIVEQLLKHFNMDRQGNIKDFQGNKIVPNTSSVAVLDVERQQALSASLMALVRKNALGFPDFTTVEAHAVGDKVFYDRKLWVFTARWPRVLRGMPPRCASFAEGVCRCAEGRH